MKKLVLGYGVTVALLVTALRLLEYRFFVNDLSIEVYVGVVALLFTVAGAWAGSRLVRQRRAAPVVAGGPMVLLRHEAELEQMGISKRELEVLELMAGGLSNQEIADKLFVSLNTVKTHAANLFQKLDVRRRTQAVQRARALGLIA
jgi:two-component system, NarL family, response regulator LiaR